MDSILPDTHIQSKIISMRGKNVILDRDLAVLYGVETKALKRAVRRNLDRFPADFMFELTSEEFEDWRCQNGTSNSDKMGLRHSPMVFTEHGILMLSSVLRSMQAVQVNIQIIRVFNSMRKLAYSQEITLEKLSQLEKELSQHNTEIQSLWFELKKMIAIEHKDDVEKI